MSAHVFDVYLVVVVQVPNVVDRVLKVLRSPGHAHICLLYTSDAADES